MKNFVNEQINTIPNIEDINFKNFSNLWINSELEESDTENDIVVQKYLRKIIFDNQELFLSALKKETSNSGRLLNERVEFIISKDKPKFYLDYNKEDGKNIITIFTESENLTFDIFFEYKDDKITAETCIIKNDKNQKLPKSMVGIVYDKIFDYIQHIANRRKQKVIHFIEHMTSISDKPLSDEKWHKIFLPIIEKHNYIPLSIDKNTTNYFWKKTYLPE